MKKNVARVLVFLIVAYFISSVLLLLLAAALYKWNISQTIVTVGIVFIYIISTFLSGLLAGRFMKRKKYVWGLVTGSLYFLVLVLISLLVGKDGIQYCGNFFSTLFLCLFSGMLGGMLG